MTDSHSISPAPGAVEHASANNHNNVSRLAIAQALAGANTAVFYAIGAVIGAGLAPDAALATLPISIFVVGMAAFILPTGIIARRYGRRAAFIAGTSCGVLTGLLAALAVFWGQFWLFCTATFFGGAYAAVVLTFRFAAADGVSPELRPRALSIVMAGGVAAGVIGPQLVTLTMNLWAPHTFVVTFLVQALVAALAGLVLMGVRVPAPSAEETATGGRKLSVLATQPRFLIAVTCGAVSYMLMNFLMTAAPLAMHLHGHSQESANNGLQWHIIAMYAPSFFTGRLITRYGSNIIVAVGLAMIGASTAIGLAGVSVLHFWAMLVLLGVGWNFGFVGASAMVLECHRPEERTRVQALNDFIVFGTMAVGSFSSGGLLASHGWNSVLWVSFIPLALVIVTIVLIRQLRS
ncbi:MFS transporter [Halopseudomonas aestusnigri]|uniref:MFS transporter n=1 Tax=Halopseudomonas aestusnigri TaxID=857252 RepID=UPI0028C2B9C8|nr:MFS transporter [Halopseudomonas aestusnigri]